MSVKRYERLIFLDRDGTLNPDPGYLSHPDQMTLFPWVAKSLRKLHDAGFGLVVVTNQSGVGRGLITLENLHAIHARMDQLLAEQGGAAIDHYALCTHRPDEGCPCRKPSPLLLKDAATRFGADLARSYMIGDKRIDLEAGKRAGCKGVIHVRSGAGAEEYQSIAPGEADYLAQDLGDAADWILRRPQ